MKTSIIILLGLVFLSSCTLEKGEKITPSSLSGNASGVHVGEEKHTNPQSPQGKITGSSEYQSCIKQSQEMCTSTTFSRMIMDMEDTNQCDSFDTEDLITRCKDMIYLVQAQKKQDISLCKNLSTGKMECEYSVTMSLAMSSGSIDPCETLASSGSDATGIAPPMESYRDRCVLSVIEGSIMRAESPFTKEVCEKLQDRGARDRCDMSFRMREDMRDLIPKSSLKGTGNTNTGSKK